MKFITVTELKARATQIVSEIEETGKGVVVTKNGLPAVYISKVAEDKFQYTPEEETKKNVKKKGVKK
jgi:prevent-host-death family protein